MNILSAKNFLFLAGCVSILCAQPTSMQVKSGDAHAEINQNTMAIHASDQAIIHWQDFSIQANEAVHFIQPSSNAVVLNRVTSDQISSIQGKLSANGKLYLINPNGIFIGAGAEIQASAFFLSTLNISDKDFLEQKSLLFQQIKEAKITNLGKITALNGDVAILATAIRNEGKIIASNGKAILAAGTQVLLHLDDKQHIAIQPTVDRQNRLDEGIVQDGIIQAIRTDIQADGNLYALAIKHTKKAQTVCVRSLNEGGIYLVADKGEIQVSGTLQSNRKNGHIHVLGENILLQDAHLDASSTYGGGEILIGGDYQGGNTEILNAKLTFVDPLTTIYSNAQGNGDGGKVIVWSDETTQFHGTIQAKGGIVSGDGGFVEISSKYHLDIAGGRYDVTAGEKGKVGEILFDPSDITISVGATSPGPFASPYNPAGVASATVNTTDLQNALASGNVSIATSNGTGGSGNITVSDTFTWSSANSLTLTADNAIIINAAISNTNAVSSATLLDLVASGTTANYVHGVEINAAITTDTGAISITGQAGAVTASRGIRIAATGAVNSTSGDITISGTAGSVGNNNIGVRIESGGGVATAEGAISITGIGQGSQTNNHGILTIGTIQATGAGTITLNGTGGGGTNSSRGVAISGAVTTNTGNIDLTGVGGTGNSTDNTGILVTATGVISSTSGAIAFDATAGTGTNTNAAIQVQAGGSVTTAGNISGTALPSSASGTNNYGIYVENTASVTATGSGTIDLTGTSGMGTLTNQGIRIEGTMTTASGSFTLTGTSQGSGNNNNNSGFASTGTSNVSSTSGDISITGNAGAALGGNHGIILNGSTVSTSGSVTFIGKPRTGAGNNTGDLNNGVYLFTGSTVSSSGSTISLTGTGGAGTADSDTNYGILVDSTSTVSSTGGKITLDGTGGAALGTQHQGVRVQGNVTSNGSIDIEITGTGGAGTTNNAGIAVSGGTVSAVNGLVTLTGTGGPTATSTSNVGVRVTNGGTVETTGSGNIVLEGTAAQIATADNYGIYFITGANSVTSLNGNVTLTGHGGPGTNNYAIVLTNGAPSVTGTGLLSLTSDDDQIVINQALVTDSGGMTITQSDATSLISLGANASSTDVAGGNIVFSGDLNITANVTIDSNGGSITLDDVTETGANTLIVDGAAGGVISIDSLAVTAFTVTDSSSTTITDTTVVPTVTLTATTNNVIFTGAVTIATALNTAADGYAVQFLGGGTVTPATTFSNTGGVVFGNGAGDSITFTGGLVNTAGTSTTFGTVQTSNTTMTLGAVTVSGTTNLNTSGGILNLNGAVSLSAGLNLSTSGGALNINSTINGGSALVANSAAGILTVAGVIGGVTPVASASLTSTNGGATSISIGQNITTANGTIAMSGPVQFTGDVTLDSGAGAGNITFSDAITVDVAHAIALDAGTGDITFAGTIGSGTALTSLALTGTNITSSVSFTPNISTSMSLSGALATTNTAITIPVALTLTGTSSAASSGSGSGDIQFSSTINGAFGFTVNSGADDITYGGAIGGTTPLTSLTTTSTGTINIASNITTANGLIDFNGAVSLTGNSVISSGAGAGNIDFSSTIDGNQTLTLSAGTGQVILSGVVGGTTPLSTFTVSGALISLGANINTNNADITMSDPVSLTSTVAISSTGGAVDFNSTINGAQALSVNSGAGKITLSGVVGGSSELSSISLTSTNGGADSITIAADINTNNGTISLSGGTTISANVVLDSGGGTITTDAIVGGLGNTLAVNGGTTGVVTIGSLNLNASFTVTDSASTTISGATTVPTVILTDTQGDITFTGAVTITTLTVPLATTYGVNFYGGGTVTNATTFNNSGGVTFGDGAADSITFTGGLVSTTSQNNTFGTVATTNNTMTLGTVVLDGTTTLSTSNGSLNLNGTVNGNASFTADAGSGVLTVSSSIGATTEPTAITLTGSTISLASNLNTNNGLIDINGAVSLAGTVVIDSGSGAGNVDFSSTINGAESLTVNSGTGQIVITGVTGGVTPLSSIALTSTNGGADAISLAANVTTNNGTISLSGDTTITNNVTLDSGGGTIDTDGITGAFTFAIDASTAGAVSLGSLNVTAFTVTNSLSTTVTGATIAPTVTLTDTVGDITFTGSVTIATALDTSSGNNYGVQLLGGGTVTPATTFANTGGVTLGDSSGDSITFTGGLVSTISTTNTFGTIATGTNNAMTLGTLILDGNSTFNTNGGTLTFSSTINGAADLVANSGADKITVSGVVGAGTELTGFALTSANGGADSITISNNINTNSGAITLSGDLTIDNNVALDSSGGAITVDNVVQSGARTLTINGGSTGTAQIDSLNISSFTVTNSGGTTITGTTTVPTVSLTNTTGDITFNGAVTITTLSTNANGYGVNFYGGGTISTATTFNNTGGVTFGDGAVDTINFTNGLVSTASTTSIFGTVTTTGKTMTLGVITLDGNTSLTTSGGALNLTGAIDGAHTFSGNSGAGKITQTGAFGASTKPTSVALTSTNVALDAISIGANIDASTGAITLTGPVTLTSSSTISNTGASGINFSSTIEGNQSLVVSSNAAVLFSGNIGNTTPLSTLTVTGSQITVPAVVRAQGGTIVFNSPVILVIDTTMTDTGTTGIIFNSTITGNYNLTLTANNGSISVSGDVDLSLAAGSAGGALTANAGNDITFEGTIDTTGGSGVGIAYAGGNVSLTSTGGNVQVAAVDSSGGTAVGVAGGNAGNITIQPASGLSGNLPSGRTLLYGNLTASGGSGTSTGNGGAISIAATGRTELPAVATIVSSTSGNDVTITGASFVMGDDEAMTIFGDVTMNLTNSVTIADIISSKTISITAPTITIQRHEPAKILDFNGALYTSEGVHLFAVEEVTLSGGINEVGAGIEADIRTVSQYGYTQSSFEAILQYNSYLLNFDFPDFNLILSRINLLNSELFFQLERCYSINRPKRQGISSCFPFYWYQKPSKSDR